MSDPLFDEDDDANTPLEAEEKEDLIPTYITLRSELNEAEQINIADALRWLARKRRLNILDVSTLKELHKRMFSDVWKWAGKYRQSEKNLGIEAYRIATEMPQLVDDVSYWVENETYPPDELAIRFSHRLVSIHPFPNGNGRHSRIASDLLVQQLGEKAFTWGRSSLIDADETRQAYVDSLRKADNGEIEDLLEFARS